MQQIMKPFHTAAQLRPTCAAAWWGPVRAASGTVQVVSNRTTLLPCGSYSSRPANGLLGALSLCSCSSPSSCSCTGTLRHSSSNSRRPSDSSSSSHSICSRSQQPSPRHQSLRCQAADEASSSAASASQTVELEPHLLRVHCSRGFTYVFWHAQILTLPTILTLGRVVAIPALIAGWFWSSPHATALVTGLFVVASLTDALDGYLARKMNASSAFGAFLDPVADKLMVAAVLVLLSTQPLAAGPLAGNAWVMPVLTLVIIGREITMSALREWAATLGSEARAAVAVNAWGKWKTATQMVSLTLLLWTRDGAAGPVMEAAATASVPLLGVAAYLTAYSLVVYLRGLWKYMV